MPEKIDLYKQHKSEYAVARKPALVEVGKAQYLAVEGEGAPGGEHFQAQIGALYSMAFTVKMTRKFAGKQDYAICKLEAQWWCNGQECFAAAPQEKWKWKLLIRTPEFVKQKDLDEALAALRNRNNGEGAERVRLETLTEGKCVQILHVGPYEKEGETVEIMKAFAGGKGLRFEGRHHEIYLSDPRRVAPEKLKTILRMPVVAARAQSAR